MSKAVPRRWMQIRAAGIGYRLVGVLRQAQIRPLPSLSYGRANCGLASLAALHLRQGFTDWRHAGEVEGDVFEPADSMYSQVPSVDQRRHVHRHDEPRGEVSQVG